jgi:hypothetical protein
MGVFNGAVVWNGVVETFELEGYATASRCYAFPFVHEDKPEIKTVLGVGAIDFPNAAVRAAIISSNQKP